MRELRWAAVMVVGALGTTVGCVDDTQYSGASDVLSAEGDREAGGEAGGDEEAGAPVTRGDALDFAECGAERSWDVPNGSWFSGASFFDISLNGGLLVWSGEYVDGVGVYNMADGALEFRAPQPLHRHSLDATWRRQLRPARGAQQRAGLYDVVSGELLQALDTPSMIEHNLALAKDGSRAASYGCTEDREGVQIQVWAVPEGRLERTLELEQACQTLGWDLRPMMALTPSGDALLFAAGDEGELTRVDLNTGAWRVVQAHTEVEEGEETWWGYHSRILDFAVQPGGARVATVGLDQTVRQWTLPDLEPVGESFEAGVDIINQDSYLPSAASPLAWSPDGALLAHVNPEGGVTVRRVEDGAPVFTHERFPLEPEARQWEGNTLVHLRFTHDGGGLAAAFENRVVLWACPEREGAEAGGEVEVRLSGPERGAVGASMFFEASGPGFGADFHGFTFAVDGEAVGWQRESGQLEWQPIEPGTYTLSVEATDGLRRGEARLTVEVAP